MATRYVNTNSTAGGDGTTNNTSGSDRAYATLADWEAARQADLTASETELCYCDGTAAEVRTTSLTIDGWTTDATHYIDIRGNTNSRASTEWSTSKYRISGQLAGSANVVDNVENYCRFDGLQFEQGVDYFNAASRNIVVLRFYGGSSLTDGCDCRVSRCHVRFTGAAPFNPMTGACYGIFANPNTVSASPTPNLYVFNNVVSFDATGTYTTGLAGWTAIECEHRNHNAYIYNNTVRGAWLYGTGNDNTAGNRVHYLKNNIFSDMVTAATLGDHTNTRCDYNATNLSDLGYTAGSNDRVSQTFTFASGTNYAITSGDAGARNFGLTDPGSGLFSDDIDGKTRSGSWDIGAFEVSASALYRIRQFANGYYQSAQFMEVAPLPALRDSVLYDDGTNNDNSATASGIVPAGTNRYGIVKVGWFANQTISSVVWGGVDITANLIKSAVHDGSNRKALAWYYYLNPPASSADVVITWGGNIQGKTMIVEAWDGVNQITPYGDLTFTADDTGGSNSDPHVMTVTAAVRKIITDCYYMWSNTASGPTIGGDQTSIESIIMDHGGGGPTACFGSSYSISDGSVDHSWDSAATATSNWCMYAISLNAVTTHAMRMYANAYVQIKEMQEIASPTTNKLNANGAYICPQFIEQA